MSGKFLYVCSVVTGRDNDILFCGAIKTPDVSTGDYVVLENGVRGIVKDVSFVNADDTCFCILCDFTEVCEIYEVYHRVYAKEGK